MESTEQKEMIQVSKSLGEYFEVAGIESNYVLIELGNTGCTLNIVLKIELKTHDPFNDKYPLRYRGYACKILGPWLTNSPMDNLNSGGILERMGCFIGWVEIPYGLDRDIKIAIMFQQIDEPLLFFEGLPTKLDYMKAILVVLERA